MATAMTNASSASRRNQTIASGPFRSISRAVALTAAAAALAAIAGCVTAPPVPPAVVTPPPAATPTAPSLPAKYLPVAWTALPGWSDDQVHEAWPAFRAGCAALIASAATSGLWQGPCAAAQILAHPSIAPRCADSSSHFYPRYQVVTADGRDTGMVTGYEPLLSGSRALRAYSVPLYAAPDDLLTMISRNSIRSSRTRDCAAASRASAWCRLVACRHRERKAR